MEWIDLWGNKRTKAVLAHKPFVLLIVLSFVAYLGILTGEVPVNHLN